MKETSTDVNRRIAWFLMTTLPAVLGFVTVGLIWILPGALLIVATVLFIRDLVIDHREKGLGIISEIPHWKRTVVLAGVLVIILPVIFGNYIVPLELAQLEQNENEFHVRPMDQVLREGPDGNTSRSEVSGVMIVHIILIVCSLTALVAGQLGARNITVASGVFICVSLLFFFLLLPNILFSEGSDFTQFEGEHFSAIAGGWFMAFFGSILIVASQFLKSGSNIEEVRQS